MGRSEGLETYVCRREKMLLDESLCGPHRWMLPLV